MVPLELDVDDRGRPSRTQRRGRGVVRRGQRRGAFGDLRGPRRSGWPPSGSCWRRCRRCGRTIGPKPTTRKVDKLSCVRFGSARYSVPNRLIGATVDGARRRPTGSCGCSSRSPGRSSPSTRWSRRVRPAIVDEHYGGPRPTARAGRPGPGPRRRRQFLRARPGRRGVPHRRRRGRGHQAGRRARRDPRPCGAAHGDRAAARRAGAGGGVRPVARRRRPLDPGHRPAPHPARRRPGRRWCSTLPTVPTRSLAAYASTRAIERR